MTRTEPYLERAEGWLWRWRIVYPTDGAIDLETIHATKLGAWFYLKFWHGM